MKTLLLAPATPRLFVIRFTIAIALLQALWIVAVPAFRNTDEFDHAYRASAVAGGQWHADRTTPDGRGKLVSARADIVRAAHPQCASLGYTKKFNCTPLGRSGPGRVWIASGAAAYNPLFYAVIGTVASPFHGVASLYAMRVGAGLMCLAFLALGAWAITRAGPPRWLALGLLLAVTPEVVWTSSVAAPNGLEMASAVALWTSLIVLPDVESESTQRSLLTVATLAGVVLATLRMLGPVFLLGVVAFAVLASPRGTLRVARNHRVRVGVDLVLLSAAAAAGLAWTLFSGAASEGEVSHGHGSVPLSTLLLWPMQTIAAMPFRDMPSPAVVYAVTFIVVGAFLGIAVRTGSAYRSTVTVLALVAALALPYVMTAATIQTQGVIWQGRYGLPFAVGFVLLAGWTLERSGALPVRWPYLALAGSGLCAGWVACYATVENQERGRLAALRGSGWHPVPLAVVILVVVTAVVLMTRSVRAREA